MHQAIEVYVLTNARAHTYVYVVFVIIDCTIVRGVFAFLVSVPCRIVNDMGIFTWVFDFLFLFVEMIGNAYIWQSIKRK